jgi:alpha-galactosidase
MVRILQFYISAFLLFFSSSSPAQETKKVAEQIRITSEQVIITANLHSGMVNYLFPNGITLDNTVAYINDLQTGFISTADFKTHTYAETEVCDNIGTGRRLAITHSDNKHRFTLIQYFTLYKGRPFIIINVTAKNKAVKDAPLETRDIGPLAILPQFKGKLFIPGTEPRILDVPFDNDNWVNVLERRWPNANSPKNSGISYEFSAFYDRVKNSGLVIGSVQHNFWKTGLTYQTANELGSVDSLKVFGGAATPDDPKLPADYGGRDGTHDLVEHGTMIGQSVHSPDICLSASNDVHHAFVEYGRVNAIINGRLYWKGDAPIYWNSFGVEGVLGYDGVMMPPAVKQISDFLHSLSNFNSHAKPVLSIDSYDQGIYSIQVLSELGKYAEQNNQKMGFYFIPFAMWGWKGNLNGRKVPGSDYQLKEVLLHDKNNEPIMYKDDKWGAYAMDPTHPAIRLYIIQQLKKARAINAKFLKIDFLSAGALESTVRYDKKVRTGIQAYDYGMKTLKFLVDSIMGKDIFITMAISPMFPSQYAHTRFVSTDVYSHLRNDQKGFPNWGSTEASLATGSHMGWVQGTLWPYTNLDVSIMKNFQRNPDLNEQEIKVRIYAMMVMGSILGDGSDFRNPKAANRAEEFLDNKQVIDFFSNPKAFIPINAADGETLDQQMSFYLPGDTTMVALFNFDLKNYFKQSFNRGTLQLDPHKKYELKDFMTNAVIGVLESDAAELTLSAAPSDALLIKLVPKE